VSSQLPVKKPGNWIWLFPLTYVCHVSEEYLGGFTSVTAVTPREFILLTSVGFLLISIGMILVRRKKSMRWVLITLSTVFFVNALSHTTWTILTRAYSPGLITSWLFWIPLALFTWKQFFRLVSPKTFWLSVVVGSLINVIVSLIAFAR
jgi:Protein of unknown function with HXXEE motif